MFAKWQNNFRTILSFSFKVIISDLPHQTEPNDYNEIIIVTMKFINLASRKFFIYLMRKEILKIESLLLRQYNILGKVMNFKVREK